MFRHMYHAVKNRTSDKKYQFVIRISRLKSN